MLIEIQNHGPLILATNYWESELAQAGKFYCSVNAGSIRLLVPPSQRASIEDMRASQYVVLSRGPWPAQGLPEAVELLFEDGSDSPFALHLAPESFDLLPAEPPAGRGWVLSVWDSKKGKPHKAVERICHWRRAPRIPWLRPWKEPCSDAAGA
jgi:hypothetical protein